MTKKEVARGQGRSRRGKREVNERFASVCWPRDLFNRVRRKEREERREGEVSVERGTPEDDRHKTGGGNSSMAEITPPNDASLVEERDMGSESACTPHSSCDDDSRNNFSASVDIVDNNIGLEDEIFF
jgi:hypothetical protein